MKTTDDAHGRSHNSETKIFFICFVLGHHAPEPHYSHPPAQYHHQEPVHHSTPHSGFGSGFQFPKGFGTDF